MTTMWRKYLLANIPREGEGAAAGAAAGAAGAAGTAGAAAAQAAAAGTAAPWHQGVDAETLGHWQNKGWKVEDPKEIAIAATKQARELEKHFGVPADQLIKMPKPDAKPEDIKAFRSRLGVPAEPKDYDFSSVKDAAGKPIAAPLADALRAAAHTAGVPKDAAATIAAAVVKQMDDARAAETATRTAAIAKEKADLAKDWNANGQNFDFNHLKAMEGARRLGISQEGIQALENQIGYKAVMQAMHKIGVGTSEDTFVDGGGGARQVTTREGAMAKKAELMADQNWGKRYVSGDVQAKQEMDGLNTLIDGNAQAA